MPTNGKIQLANNLTAIGLDKLNVNPPKELISTQDPRLSVKALQTQLSLEPEFIVAEELPNPQEEGLLNRAIKLLGVF